MTIDLAARVSRGTDWPDKQLGGAPASVVILTTEDDPEDTIRPRAECAGADFSKLHVIQGVERKARSVTLGGKTISVDRIERGFDLATDLALLRKELERIQDVALVIIDPITAYQPKINSDKNNEVRASLVGLEMLAKEFQIAIIAIMHLNKSATQDAIHRTSGSVGYVAAARAVFLVTRQVMANPNDDLRQETFLFLPIKNNLAPLDNGLTYKLAPAWTGERIEMRSIEWHGSTDISASDALALPNPKRADDPEKLNYAKDFLKALLAEGPKTTREVEEDAKENRIKIPTLMRARKELGIENYKEKGALQGPWFLKLPSRMPIPVDLLKKGSTPEVIRSKGGKRFRKTAK